MAMVGPQKQKILHLLAVFQEETDAQHGLSMPQLIDRMAARGVPVERKAMYRDIAALREFGYDIKKIKGAPVEYALVNRPFSEDEVELLLNAVQSSRFLTEGIAKKLQRNIKTLVPKHARRRLNKQVTVANRVKMQNDSVFGTLNTVQECMRCKKQVEFQYFSYDFDGKRELHYDGRVYVGNPVGLVYSEGCYYMLNYSEKYEDVAVYRLDRMVHVVMGENPIVRNSFVANFDMDAYTKSMFGMFNGDKERRVELLVKKHAADGVIDRFGKDTRFFPVKGNPDWAKATVSVMTSPIFFSWIARFNGEVQIAKPAIVRNEYSQYLHHLLEPYE